MIVMKYYKCYNYKKTKKKLEYMIIVDRALMNLYKEFKETI